MRAENFERMEGLSSIKDTNLLVNALARLSKDLFEEGFEKEEIIEYFQKVVEMEVESALDVVEVEGELQWNRY
jgi:signal-transduction protein with cAMP-binding, CBS, and nucleotidyltransferase domain